MSSFFGSVSSQCIDPPMSLFRKTSERRTSGDKCFAQFDEKKDYVRRCSLKNGDSGKKAKPECVSFCLGK